VVSNTTHFQQVLAARMAGMRRDAKPPRPRQLPAAPSTAPGQVPDVFTRREAAQYCRVSLSTFKTWNVPEFRAGRIVRIRREDLEAFMKSRIAKGSIDEHATLDHAPQKPRNG
jgi:hypothetical protein